MTWTLGRVRDRHATWSRPRVLLTQEQDYLFNVLRFKFGIALHCFILQQVQYCLCLITHAALFHYRRIEEQ